MKKISKKLLLFEDLLFISFIFLIPSQLAYHLWPNWAFVGGVRVDYYAPAVYITDILILAILATHLTRIVITKGVRVRLSSFTILILGVLSVLAVANIYYSILPMVSFMKWIKVVELMLIALYIKRRSNFNVRRLLVMPLLYSVVFFGVIGIFQFYYQRSIGGLFYVFGERSFTSDTIGIAVVDLLGIEKLRMYSTFPHPNALAGFTGVVGLILLIYRKRIIKSDKTLFWMSILILSTVLLLTFSKTVYISIVIVGLMYLLLKNQQRLFDKATKFLFLVIVVLSFFLSIMSVPVIDKGNYKTVSERIVLANVAGKTFSENIITGVGANGFIYQLSKRDVPTNVRWLLQPVHNAYLLLLSEMGLLLFIIAIFLLFKILTMTLEIKSLFIFPYLFILTTGIFDHYWLTIQQNQLIATVVFAVIIREYYEKR